MKVELKCGGTFTNVLLSWVSLFNSVCHLFDNVKEKRASALVVSLGLPVGVNASH